MALPDDAFGLTRVPAGMASSDRAAALLGLGFPHMLVLTDEAVPPLAGYADYKRRYLGATIVPRALLPVMYSVPYARGDDALDEAVKNPPAIDLDEAVEASLKQGGPVFVLEGLFGSVATAEAIVAALTAENLAGGTYENYGPSIIHGLGFMLFRVPAKVRDKLRADLASVLERLRANDQVWHAGKAIDVIINGRAGVERSGYRFANQPNGYIHFGNLIFADDDPVWLAERIAERFAVLEPAHRESFDIQLAVVGGSKVLSLLRKNIGAFNKDQAKRIADQLSLVT